MACRRSYSNMRRSSTATPMAATKNQWAAHWLICQAGRAIGQPRRVVRRGDPTVQHHQLDGPAHAQYPVVVCQFERELIGERVRDKIAASKRKGIWVGGPVRFVP